MIDDFTCFTWIIPMFDIASVKKNLTTFINTVENKVDSRIKIICIDNGIEFILNNYFLVEISCIKRHV